MAARTNSGRPPVVTSRVGDPVQVPARPAPLPPARSSAFAAAFSSAFAAFSPAFSAFAAAFSAARSRRSCSLRRRRGSSDGFGSSDERPFHARFTTCAATSSRRGLRTSSHHWPVIATIPTSICAYIGANLSS